MSDNGKYRNEIENLDNLEITDYERIFKVFKEGDYYFYNTLNKIEFPTIDDEYLGRYEVKTKSPLTKISYDIYGDIKSWWIVVLLNKELFKDITFVVDGGVVLNYILPPYRSLIYNDITNSTIYSGRHF